MDNIVVMNLLPFPIPLMSIRLVYSSLLSASILFTRSIYLYNSVNFFYLKIFKEKEKKKKNSFLIESGTLRDRESRHEMEWNWILGIEY